MFKDDEFEHRLISTSADGTITAWNWTTRTKAEELKSTAKTMFPTATYTIQSRRKQQIQTRRFNRR